jgi:hypothetical protein
MKREHDERPPAHTHQKERAKKRGFGMHAHTKRNVHGLEQRLYQLGREDNVGADNQVKRLLAYSPNAMRWKKPQSSSVTSPPVSNRKHAWQRVKGSIVLQTRHTQFLFNSAEGK